MSEPAAGSAGMALCDVFGYNALHYPGKVAIRVDGQAATYRELAGRVAGLRGLLGQHVGPGERVGLWMHNSADWMAAFVALNSLGAVTVPLSTRLTASEVGGILGDAGACAVVAARRYRGRDYFDEAAAAAAQCEDGLLRFAPGGGTGCGGWTVAGRRRSPPASRAGGRGSQGHAADRDLLCIQYTSGTTSTPKGVMLSNDNYLRTAAYVARCQRLTPSSRFVSAGPFFHCSGSMHAIAVCLLAGCTLTSMSTWDPARFLDLVREHACDTAHMVYFRDVLQLGDPAARAKLESLQVAHDLGTADYLARLHGELGIPGISNIYGMTETAGQFTMWFPDDPLAKRISANGRPQPGNAVRIVDPATGRLLGPDQAGEIQMRGPTVSRGYFRRPEADREAYTDDGWLRSGDIGTLSEEGELTYVARAKEIIRVGGENVAPAEVEQAIRDHCRIHHVCVLGVPHERLDEVPAAVVVEQPGADWAQVLAQLRGRVAGFKIPTAVYVADALPMTMSNKVQRGVLRQWIADGRLKKVV